MMPNSSSHSIPTPKSCATPVIAALCLSSRPERDFANAPSPITRNTASAAFAGLKYLDDLGEVDLGYRLMVAYWGRGLATEASLACVNYGFQTLELKRIIGLVAPQNHRSVRVLEKCGMAFERMIDSLGQQMAQYAIDGGHPV
jgi:RimJ/RimL family protein N-acetyltransferase